MVLFFSQLLAQTFGSFASNLNFPNDRILLFFIRQECLIADTFQILNNL